MANELARIGKHRSPTVPRRRLRGLLAAGTAALFAVAGAVLATSSAHAAAGTPTKDVQANLWEWNWTSVARECRNVLGPAGYGGVQVAPPADSLSRDYTTSDAPILHPWWDVYQPVDYVLNSRFGTETDFRKMVTTCRNAGVKVYVDAVINHMTGQGHKSYRGVEYTHFSYPDYSYNDFHHKGTGPYACPSASGGIEDFNNFQQLTKCELLGLADLRTDSGPTRAVIAAYLNKLIRYGVSGFRVDAAKHIGETDLIAIQKLLNDTADGTRPTFELEVFPGSPGEGSQMAFTKAGTVLGFDYAYQIKNAFKSYNNGGGNITSLKVFGADAGLVPSDKSLVFIENHDTERGSDTLSYKDGATNTIANEFMLAYPYGTPQVYSAFAFTNSYDSPPATAAGYVTGTSCSNGRWVCVDRYQGVTGMVAFHNYVGNAPLQYWYDDHTNLIGFSRGDKGYFTTNNATSAKTVTVHTGMAPGTYCDLIHGSVSGGACSGPTVVVNGNGVATIPVGAQDSVAFTQASRV